MSMADTDLAWLMALKAVPGIGDQLARNLLESCGGAQEVFKLPKGKLQRIPGIGPRTAESIHAGPDLDRAYLQLERAKSSNTRVISFLSPAYPRRLASIPDAPAILYIKGNANLGASRILGIVGTRRATSYGKHVTESILQQLVPFECTVLSGLAYGIDISAHRNALLLGLPTIAVMGSGTDIIYPSAHQSVASQMLSNGGLISELPIGTLPESHYFPARNRIIAGLCDAILVVEAARTGGALITARLADSYHRDVFAIPGNVDSPYSEGCNHLIRNHLATVVTTGQELAESMNWKPGHEVTEQKASNKPEVIHPAQQKVIDALSNRQPVHIEQLRFVTGLSSGELAAALLNLECHSFVECLPGKMFRRSRSMHA